MATKKKKKKTDFALNAVFGIWKGRKITLKSLREKAWGRRKLHFQRQNENN